MYSNKGERERHPLILLLALLLPWVIFNTLGAGSFGRTEDVYKTSFWAPSQIITEVQGANDPYSWSNEQGRYSSGIVNAARSRLGSASIHQKLAFMGIFCRKEDAAKRILIRQTNMQLLSAGAVTAKFVVCHPFALGFEPSLWAEMQEFRDIYLIDCIENMNEGKTLNFFQTVRQRFPEYMFYGKMDTDSYVLFHNLASALLSAPKCRFYGGRSNIYKKGVVWHISGSMYILSADMVHILEGCDSYCQQSTTNIEDMQIGEIFERQLGINNYFFGDLGKNNSILYDRDASEAKVMPWTVQVHDLKTPKRWWEIHKRFVYLLNNDKAMGNSDHSYFNGPDTKIDVHNCSSDSFPLKRTT